MFSRKPVSRAGGIFGRPTSAPNLTKAASAPPSEGNRYRVTPSPEKIISPSSSGSIPSYSIQDRQIELVQSSGNLSAEKNRAKFFNDTVRKYYAQPRRLYNEITIMHGGKQHSWVNLPIKDRFGILEKGATGGSKCRVSQRKTQWEEKRKEDADAADREATEFIRSNVKPATERGQFSHVHDIGHAIRTSILVEAIAGKYKNLFEEFNNISERDISLASLAALFHDSGRQSDGVDIYDDASADNAEKELIGCGCSEDTARACAEAIRHKDDADFIKKENNVAKMTILLHDADSLEIARCQSFESRYLLANSLTRKNGVTQEQVSNCIEELLGKVVLFIKRTQQDPELKAITSNPSGVKDPYEFIRKIACDIELLPKS